MTNAFMCIASALTLAAALGTSAIAQEKPAAEIRGIWMHAPQAKTRAGADECISQIDRANLNAAFILVWYWGGQAYYRTELAPMAEGVEAGFDPLAYLIEQCHRRGIEVHAWFVNGAYGAPKPRHVLDKHPDWAVDAGATAELWYDFGKPEVRKFQSDLMLDCLKHYQLDGIHFDYIRYGPHDCFCSHCQQEFAKRYGHEPLTAEMQRQFPAATGVGSNPVARPTTAKVLAEFSNGLPAIAVNELGKGYVLLLNWHAEDGLNPAVAEVVRRALAKWDAAGDPVFVLNTKPNRDRYGNRSQEAATALFRRLGHKATAIAEDGLSTMPPDATLVLGAVYYLPDEVAGSVEQFVKAGGTLVVIDGPVFSIRSPVVQRLLGMSDSEKFFSGQTVIRAVGQSDLVPDSGRQVDPARQEQRARDWAEFRKWGVSELVRDVYRRAKQARPDALVTAAVFSTLESAEGVLQDWPRWLREGTIDYVVPMAYTLKNDQLAGMLAQYKTVDPDLQRIIPGLSLYEKTDGGAASRQPDLVLSQHRMSIEAGARGNLYFALQHLNDPLIEAFHSGAYRKEVPAYRPPARNTQ